MDILEARELAKSSLQDFILNEANHYHKVQIILAELQSLGYEIWIVLDGRYTVEPTAASKAILGSISRKRRKQAKGGGK